MPAALVLPTAGQERQASAPRLGRSSFSASPWKFVSLPERLPLGPWTLPEQPWQSRLSAASGDYPVDQKQQECADDGSDEPRALARLVPADRMTDPSGHQRTGNAKQDRDDAPARVSSGHQELG